MKKLVTIIMAVVLMIPLAACGETKKPTEEISDSTEVTTENSTTEKSETEGNTTVENGKNISVLFFSVTGTTRNVAQKIAGTLGTDTMGIIPKEECWHWEWIRNLTSMFVTVIVPVTQD